MDALGDLRVIAVREALGEIVGSDVMIETALRALLEGVDSPSLPLLAGLGRSEEDEAHDLFRRVSDELNIAPPSPLDTESARWGLVRWVCEAIVEGTISPEMGGSIIWHDGWHRLGYPDSLQGVVGAVSQFEDWSPVWDVGREHYRQMIVEAARVLLAGPWPPTIGERFTDAVALWRLSANYTREVIDAAVACLVAGADTPSLRVLAGAPPTESQFVLDPLISATLMELDLPMRDESPQAAGMRAIARRYQRGELEARELTSWAHRFIGHEGDTRCQVFVELDDTFYIEFNAAADEARLLAEVDAFLKGLPSPMEAESLRDSPTARKRWTSRLRLPRRGRQNDGR